jgi:hypothetical protein
MVGPKNKWSVQNSPTQVAIICKCYALTKKIGIYYIPIFFSNMGILYTCKYNVHVHVYVTILMEIQTLSL